jgi:hypothetical protein
LKIGDENGMVPEFWIFAGAEGGRRMKITGLTG